MVLFPLEPMIPRWKKCVFAPNYTISFTKANLNFERKTSQRDILLISCQLQSGNETLLNRNCGEKCLTRGCTSSVLLYISQQLATYPYPYCIQWYVFCVKPMFMMGIWHVLSISMPYASIRTWSTYPLYAIWSISTALIIYAVSPI